MKIYLVGGAIRNKLLGIPIKDKDWVVVGATPNVLLKMNFKRVGKDFPVFLDPINKEEYSLARIDKKFGLGYKGFATDYSIHVTLQEDLMRRDLTINAIAQDEKGRYIDPFNGMSDIKNRILRHVSPAFCEDPLRILRIARFCAALNHLGFSIAQETIKIMSDIVQSKELLHLTQDRIWKETEKALSTQSPHVYFQVLYNCRALSIIFPEINLIFLKSMTCLNGFFHNHFNASYVLMTFAKLSIVSQEVDVRFAYLFLCITRILFYDFHNLMFFFNKIKLMPLLKCFFQRFIVPTYIRDLSIIFSKFYRFLSCINYQSSHDIVMFFCSIDAWRKPNRINKLAVLSDFYSLHYKENNKLNKNSGTFLKSVFIVSNSISTKKILNSGFSGIGIKNELLRLRIEAIEFWRRKNIID